LIETNYSLEQGGGFEEQPRNKHSSEATGKDISQNSALLTEQSNNVLVDKALLNEGQAIAAKAQDVTTLMLRVEHLERELQRERNTKGGGMTLAEVQRDRGTEHLEQNMLVTPSSRNSLSPEKFQQVCVFFCVCVLMFTVCLHIHIHTHIFTYS